jgi:hypothetical protein
MVPIVMVACDAVTTGFVASLARSLDSEPASGVFRSLKCQDDA